MLFSSIIQRILVLIFISLVNYNTKNLAIKKVNESNKFLIRGRSFCFSPKLDQVPCVQKYFKIGLKDSNGQLYFLNSGESAKTLVKEKKLKTQEFQLILSKVTSDNTYEIVKAQLVRNNKIYDFYYFCEVCNITTYIPSACMCCRAPTEYKESPVIKN